MADLAQIRNGFVGLTTARSADATPPGGLLEAENVCIRTENVITPRPAFEGEALPAALSTEAFGRVEYPLEGNEAGLLIDATKTLWDGYSASAGTVVTEGAANLTWNAYSGQVARRSLYLATADALRAIHAPNDAIAYRAGVPVPAIVSVTTTAEAGTGPALDGDLYRAYRVVARRAEASNGQSHVVRSAPSNRAIWLNSGTNNATLRVALHDNDTWLAGDILEVYSTEESTVYPGDEMYLNQEVEVTAAHISAGYVDVLDDNPDASLGMALYTNDSREGAESGNRRPPAAKALAWFNNSLYLGNLTYPAALQLRYPAIFTGGADTTDLIGLHAASGTFTNGSAVITGVADTSNVKVGMLLYRSTGGYADEWSGTGQIRVTAVVANTSITVSQTWTGATGAESPFFEDSIRIGSDYYPARYLVDTVRGLTVGDDFGGTASATVTAEWLSDQPRPSPTLLDNRQMEAYIECLLANTTPPEVWATNGHLYSPALPEPTEANGLAMPQDILPDHVAWSKQDEPEHFALTNIDRVGDGGATVYGLAPSRGALLTATDQGLWRVYGYADSTVSFSELDRDVRVLGTRCMAVCGPKVYLAADRGVYECDENEAINITENRVNDMDAMFRSISNTRASALKVVSCARTDEVLVCLPETTASDADLDTAYVFNTSTRAWTKWVLPRPVFDVTVKGRLQRIHATVSGAEVELVENALGYDAHPNTVTDIEVSAVTGTSVTFDSVSAALFDPVIGDAVEDGGELYLLTDGSGTAWTVHKEGLTTGLKTAHKGTQCTITPSVNTLKTPHFMKVWAEGAIHWAKRTGVYAYTLAFRSAITGTNTAATQTRVLAPLPSEDTDARSTPSSSRFTVSRAAARGTHLCFSIGIRQAGSSWAIEALSVRARTTADKAPARLP